MEEHRHTYKERRESKLSRFYLVFSCILCAILLYLRFIEQELFHPIYSLENLEISSLVLYGLFQDLFLLGVFFLPKNSKVILSMCLLFLLIFPHLSLKALY